VAVADAFDVMVCDQPYRKAGTLEDAVAEIRRCSGTQFDPKVVMAFHDWVQVHGDPRKQQSPQGPESLEGQQGAAACRPKS